MQSRIVRAVRIPFVCSFVIFGAGCVELGDGESEASDESFVPTQEGAVQLVAEGEPTPVPPATCTEGDCYQETTLASGPDWVEQHITGYAMDEGGAFYDENVFLLRNSGGIQSSPLPTDIKTDLEDPTLVGDQIYSVGIDVVNEIQLSEQLGYLTPALLAIAEPDDSPPIVPEQAIQKGSSLPNSFFWGKCGNQYPEYTKSININEPINNTRNIGDGFTGTVSMTGSVQASATVTIKLERKRFKLFGVCIPYAVRFVEAKAYGNSTASPAVSLTGTLSYKNSWQWDIAEFDLGTFSFTVFGLPVRIPITMPVKAGLSLDANVTGTVAYNASQTATGNFNYKCTLDGCSGTSSYSLSGNLAPTYSASVSARVQPTVWADVAIRASLYADWLAYAQVGLRPYAYGDFWAYHGTTCGDANADGINEMVDAATFDLDWQAFVTAETSTLGTIKKWDNLNNSVRRHVGFWDLIGSGGSNALTPMLTGATSSLPNLDQTYGVKMRPCWPYADPVNYALNWGNNSVSSKSGVPANPTPINGKWTSAGTYGMTLTAVNDNHGRPLQRSTTQNVQVNAGPGYWTNWLDRDDPEGIGDEETVSAFVGAGQACANPRAIECQTTNGTHWALAGETMKCDTTTGGLCKNQGQTDGACMDYKVRYFCY